MAKCEDQMICKEAISRRAFLNQLARLGWLAACPTIVLAQHRHRQNLRQLVSASTANLAGVPTSNGLTFSLSSCLYLAAAFEVELASAFTYAINGVAISEVAGVAFPATNNPLTTDWAIVFAAGAIQTARGSGSDAWEDDDVITVELTQASADTLRIRPDCAFANIDPVDVAPIALPPSPVDNLYTVPRVLSVTITGQTATVVFNVPVSDSSTGGINDAALFNCDTNLALPITGVTGNGTTTLTYTFTGTINPGDNVTWVAEGLPQNCELHDITVGTNDNGLRGYRTLGDPAGGFGSLTPQDGEFANAYQVTVDTGTDLAVIRLGAGDEQDAGGNDQINVAYGGFGEVTYFWNATNLRYEVTDAALTTYIENSVGVTVRLGANVAPPDNIFDLVASWVQTGGWTDNLDGTFSYVNAGATDELRKNITSFLTTGNTYRLTYTMMTITADGIFARFVGASGPRETVPGTYSTDFLYSGGTDSRSGLRTRLPTDGVEISSLTLVDLGVV